MSRETITSARFPHAWLLEPSMPCQSTVDRMFSTKPHKSSAAVSGRDALGRFSSRNVNVSRFRMSSWRASWRALWLAVRLLRGGLLSNAVSLRLTCGRKTSNTSQAKKNLTSNANQRHEYYYCIIPLCCHFSPAPFKTDRAVRIQ